MKTTIQQRSDMNIATIREYEQKADRYAERYGILNYHVVGHLMTYTQVFPIEGSAYRVTVDLNVGSEKGRTAIKGTELKHLIKPYKARLGIL